MKIKYNNKIYPIYNIQIVFGINVKTIKRYEKIFNSDEIELEDLVDLYNKEHPNTTIDIVKKLEIKEAIENDKYTTFDKNNVLIEVNYNEIVELIKSKNPKVKNEAIYIFLRKRYESGITNDGIDIVAEYEKSYNDIKSKNYTYLYPDKDGKLVMTPLNTILRDLKIKNPELKINFDSFKRYIELAMKQGTSPEGAVERGIELYISNVAPKKTYLLMNPETGEYEEVHVGKIREYWKKEGLPISKTDTVNKFLNEASKIPGITPEELVDKALELAKIKIQKYDYEIDGKFEKMTLSEIAKNASIPESSLRKEVLKIKNKGENLSELELIKKAIEEVHKNKRITYPYLDEDGNLLELSVTEIARKCNVNRNVLSQNIKLLEKNNNEYPREEIILTAIEQAKSTNSKGSHYYPDKEYDYVLENGETIKVHTKDLVKIVKEKYGIKIIPENLQKTMDKILASGDFTVNEACKKAAMTIQGKQKLLTKPESKDFSDLSTSDLAIVLGISIDAIEKLKKKSTDKDGLIDIDKFEEECEKIYQRINQRKTSSKENSFIMPDGKTSLKAYCAKNKYNYSVIKNILNQQIVENGNYNIEEAIANYIENGQREVANYKFSFSGVLYRHAALLAGLDFDKIVYKMRKDKIDLKKASELVILSTIPDEMDYVSSTISNMLYSKSDEELKGYFLNFSQTATDKEKECLNGVWEKVGYITEINKYVLFSNFLQKRNLTLSDDISQYAKNFNIEDFDKFKRFLNNFEGTPSYLKSPSQRKNDDNNITSKD